MKFIRYCRYSPRPELSDATGLKVKSVSNDEQLAIIDAKLISQGHKPFGEPIFDEGVSRDDIERKTLFDRVKKLSRKDGLAVYDLDRLGDLLVIELTMHWLRKAGARLWTATTGIEGDGDDDKLLRGVKGLMNGREKSKSAQRTSDVMRLLQSQGWAMGGIAPYGFKFVHAPGRTNRGNPKKRRLPDEYEQGVLRFIKELVDLGNGPDKIARILTDDGKVPRGEGWYAESISRIIKDLPNRIVPMEATQTP